MFELFGSPSLKDVMEKTPPVAMPTSSSASPEQVSAPEVAKKAGFAVFQDGGAHGSEPKGTAFPIFQDGGGAAEVISQQQEEEFDDDRTASSRVFSSLFASIEAAAQEDDMPLEGERDETEADNEQAEDKENLGMDGRRINSTQSAELPAGWEARVLVEQDPKLYSSGSGELLDEEEECVAEQDPQAVEPPGTLLTQANLPQEGEGFEIYQDDPSENGADLDHSFSFAPLEAILEAPSDNDETINSTTARGPAFPVFRD